jgi:hypothetical protein
LVKPVNFTILTDILTKVSATLTRPRQPDREIGLRGEEPLKPPGMRRAPASDRHRRDDQITLDEVERIGI